jgi:hypothetical protein
MSHAESFFAAAAQICRDFICYRRSSGDRARAAARPQWAPVPDRRRWQRGQLQPRGQRLSQALRHRSAYSPVDNVSELTARTNDEGWDTVFAAWLEISRLNAMDAILVYSVGGGDAERNISANIVKAVDLAKARSARVFGIVGRNSGYTAMHGDVVV